MINKAVYSHWSKPVNSDSWLGFASERSLIASLYLSVLFSRKWFDEVELVTDTKGKELLIDKYDIPFTSYNTELNKIDKVSKKHWAFGKLIACELQTKPFIHIDNDVIWFKKPPARVLESKSCFQNVERSEYQYQFYNQLAQHANLFFKEKKKFVNYLGIKAVNCGIMAFNDLTVIKPWVDYARDYIKYYNIYSDKINKMVGYKMSPIIFEQLHLFYFLREYGYDPYHTISPNIDYIDKQEAIDLGYTHMISITKRKPHVEKKVLLRLEKEDKEFYKKLIKLSNK